MLLVTIALAASYLGLIPDSEAIIRELIAGAEGGIRATTGPRFFGWVIGNSHPTGVAADWLTAAWGQNAANAANMGLGVVNAGASLFGKIGGNGLVVIRGVGECLARQTFAQFERRLIGQRTKEALAVKRSQGIRLGRPRVVAADTVGRIVELRSTEMSYRAIGAQLEAN